MKVKKLSLEDYTSVYEKVPRLCVDLICRNKSGVLLILRGIDPGKGLWHFPGGTVLKGESVEDALARIALEETGLEVLQSRLLGVMEFSNAENLFYHTISLVYEVDCLEGELKGGFQGKQLQYFESIPDGLIDEQKQFLQDAGMAS